MKASIICASLLAGLVVAAPADKGVLAKPKYGKDCDKDGYLKNTNKGFPIPFTSTYRIKATPDQVVNANNTFTGGLAGAVGFYDIGINTELDTICYYIRLYNFQGNYQSPARTATHLHQAAKGKSGPPRIAFSNPSVIPGKDYRVTAGCQTGPFTTGVIVNATGLDTGAGFKVAQIEANPAGFFVDVHSSLAVPGAVRGQMG
ncbi:hypothetical protein B0A48_09289 [Cryoendolithus antarcticus]|uniref:CHRD domain-containing protein n=1 Tax=Cryoendolithus antarcticus TaxID=1507870 RepID=A0A1V8T2G2_9PEZI|nr:hypothetical protein B0A48_09289 [Cryoendolithus antarcticus]